MKRILPFALLSAALMAVGTTSSQAQSYGGAVLNHDIMMPTDFASLSQGQVFGTARSMAMGGAFTSLGADISSIDINPAGLGMFTSDVVSLTPMVSVADASTAGVPSWTGNNKTKMTFANAGAVYNLAESSSASIISLNFGVSYNRVADYNTRTSFSSESLYSPSTNNLVPTIADVFMYQLDGANLYPSSNGSMDYDNNPYYWPAQGAYKTYLVDPASGNNGWATNVIGHNASVLSSYEVLQSGRTEDLSLAIGGNIGNYLYFGATMGVRYLSQTTEYVYQEEYNYYDDGGYAYASASDDSPLDYQAAYTNLWQRVELDGVGVNLKLGAIIRPVRALRIGVAFHTPTYYTISRSYTASTQTQILGNYSDLVASETFTSTSPEFIDSYEYSWKFRTPSKLLVGASLQVGNAAILSVDYERQWYNWIRVTNAPGDLTTYDYQQSYVENYQPTNTLRVGVEVKPIPAFALRAGGGVTTSMLKDESLFYSSPVETDSNYITCGVGFQLSATTSLDIAYQYHHQNYSSYKLFYVESSSGSVISSSDTFNTSLDRNFITATLTFRM